MSLSLRFGSYFSYVYAQLHSYHVFCQFALSDLTPDPQSQCCIVVSWSPLFLFYYAFILRWPQEFACFDAAFLSPCSPQWLLSQCFIHSIEFMLVVVIAALLFSSDSDTKTIGTLTDKTSLKHFTMWANIALTISVRFVHCAHCTEVVESMIEISRS